MGGENEDVLPVMTVWIVHVLWHIRELAIPIQPEVCTIAAFTIGSWGASIVHPSFGQDSLPCNTSILEVHLSETSIIHSRSIEIGRAQRRATHVLFEDSPIDAKRIKESRVHIAKERLVGRETATKVAHHDISASARVLPMCARLVFQRLREGIETHVAFDVKHDIDVRTSAIVLVPLQSALHLHQVVKGDGFPSVSLPFWNVHRSMNIDETVLHHNAD